MSAETLVRAEFDPRESDSATLAVVEALSFIADDLPKRPPIGDVIDTDAVDSLFSGTGFGHEPSSELRLTFPYERWLITISGAGEVAVSRRESGQFD